MTRAVLIAIGVFAVIHSGWALPPVGNMVVDHRPGDKTALVLAPHDATFELFQLEETGQSQSTRREAVEKTHYVGFVREFDGSLVSYAGGQKILLPEGTYRWQITPESRPAARSDFAEIAARPLVEMGVVMVRVREALIPFATMVLCAILQRGGGA